LNWNIALNSVFTIKTINSVDENISGTAIVNNLYSNILSINNGNTRRNVANYFEVGMGQTSSYIYYDNTGKFGSINTNDIHGINDPEGSSYVQSYIFAMKLDTLVFLISKDIFSITSYSKKTKERNMSRLIIENGWNIGCLMKYYKGVDFRFLTDKSSEYKPFLGDPLIMKNFSDKLFNNFFELVFINANCFDFNLSGFSIS
jgi:hypothetical protein